MYFFDRGKSVYGTFPYFGIGMKPQIDKPMFDSCSEISKTHKNIF